MQALKDAADEEAVAVFGNNLRELLLAAPAGPSVAMGIDPGFRTGCKLAIVDGTGKFLEHATVFPTAPRHDTEGANRILDQLIEKYNVKLLAIGNGTASRETDAFICEFLRQTDRDITKVVVSESGRVGLLGKRGGS